MKVHTSASLERQISIFLSSTFKDMEAERDLLLQHIFPVFRKKCLERKVVFTEIDLRWGITEEDAKNGQTIEICLKEIERCKKLGVPPFFIGFMGERYGWTPQEDDLFNYWKNCIDEKSVYTHQIREALSKELSVTDLEMRFGFLENTDEEMSDQRVQVYFRSKSLTDELALLGTEADFYENETATKKLESLKELIRNKRSNCIGIDGYTSLEEFGQNIQNFLNTQLDLLFPIEDIPDSLSYQKLEHQLYALSRIDESYVPSVGFLEILKSDIQKGLIDNEPTFKKIVVQGQVGQGKSALMANLFNIFEQENITVIPHFIGIDGDHSLTKWRDRIFQYAEDDIEELENAVTESEHQKWNNFSNVLSELVQGQGRQLLLILDGVEQLQPLNRALDRLNEIKIPDKVVLITTSTEIGLSKEWYCLQIPQLNPDFKKSIIDKFLSAYSKTLPAEMVNKIINAPQSNNTLFLRCVLDELRLYGRYETLAQRLEQLLSYNSVSELCSATLSQIDLDFAKYGRQLATQAIFFLIASRDGISQHDLAELLVSLDFFESPRLPDYILSPLLTRLSSFCISHDGHLKIINYELIEKLLNQKEQIENKRYILLNHYNNKGDSFSIAERIHQSLELNNTSQLILEVGDILNFCILQENYPELAKKALLHLKADQFEITTELKKVINFWKTSDFAPSEVQFKKMNKITGWLSNSNMLQLGDVLSERVVQYNNFDKINSEVIVESYNNIANILRLLNKDPCRVEEIYLSIIKKNVEEPIFLNSKIDIVKSNLIQFYIEQGRYTEAEKLCKEVIEIRRQRLPKDRLPYAYSLQNLATIYRLIGKYDNSYLIQEKALEEYLIVLPRNNLSVTHCFYNLGLLNDIKGKYNDAILFHNEALEIRKGILNKNNPLILDSFSAIGSVYSHLGEHIKADFYYKESIEIARKIFPKKHSKIANILNNLGVSLVRSGNSKEAEVVFKEVLEIQKNIFNDDHPSLLNTLNNLATVSGEFKDRERIYKEIIIKMRKSFDENHPKIAYIIYNLATEYLNQRKYIDAELLLLEVLNIRRKILKEDHPDIVEVLITIATVYFHQTNYTLSEKFWLEVLKITKNRPLRYCSEVSKILQSLGVLYGNLNNFKKSEECYLEALEIRREHLPPEHKEIATTLQSFANLYLKNNRYNESLTLFKEALDIRRKILKKDDPILANTLNRLGEVYIGLGLWDKAEKHLLEALDIRRKTLKLNHADISVTLDNLRKVYQEQGRTEEAE